jgi:hypothetical protein
VGGHLGLYRCRVPDDLVFDEDHEDDDDDDGLAVGIVEERPPLREGKNLEAAYVALNQAFRGIWIEKALEHGYVREYWDEGDIDEMETLTLDGAAQLTGLACPQRRRRRTRCSVRGRIRR